MRSARYAQDAISDRLKLYSTTSKISPSSLSGLKSLKRRYPPSTPIPKAENNSNCILECKPLDTDGKGNFFDAETGRKVILKGINVDSQTKLPAKPYMPSFEGDCTDPNNIFFDGDTVSFVGRPFPLAEAKVHLERIKSWGYNIVRYLLTWEAIEHEGPGKYDQEFADYTIEMLKIIGETKGMYVILEFHQDVWSRFSGGSGAPMWTLYAAGLEPKHFAVTEAAILHNDPRFYDETEVYHKMLWTSNYKRLVALTMFTMFFAGKNYFPNLSINGENIQDYLQNKYLGAVDFIWREICKKVPDLIENGTILGFESMNEPNCGLIGHDRLDYIPANQQLRVGTTPTAFQAMKLGMGFTCEVDEYQISITGPRKFGTKIVDPKGIRAWMLPETALEIDSRYGFKRSNDWELGTCPFAKMGIWEWPSIATSTDPNAITQFQRLEISAKCKMLEPEFFCKAYPQHNYAEYFGSNHVKVDTEFFINYHFVNHIIEFKKVIRKHAPNVFLLLSTPVLEQPPDIVGDERKIIDNKTIYCPHYYDGLSLMFKSWNTRYNVDTLGIMRGSYLNPVLGIVFGERAIGNCIRNQFIEMRKECDKYLGKIPILMSETGMPFDMDDKRSYRNGKFISQTSAIDVLCNALEGANMSHTFWCYNSMNNHKWGDNWNNEDFSFWSPDDRNLTFEDEYEPISNGNNITLSGVNRSSSHLRRKARKLKRERHRKSKRAGTSTATLMENSSSRNSVLSSSSLASESSICFEDAAETTITSMEEYDTDDLASTSMSTTASEMSLSSQSSGSIISSNSSNIYRRQLRKCYPSPDGVRAVSAVIRPYMIATRGTIVESEFDIKSCKYSLQLSIDKSQVENKFIPTIIFVPLWHFPFLDYGDIYLTSGYIKYNESLQYIEWYHASDPSIVQEEEMLKEEKSGITTETIVIKNNSGSLEEIKMIEKKAESGCPVM
ncbi:hypothetical protein KGF56_003644 [Candida oxycetoniae]|uniref:Uncharacterized protein n=1 Tax=Candida oxycetoniae TaxID=497107 RepID=A0AAI9SVP5_9ASCO|nr:uncharacterized protein KGF56_003644 [Candida oxycetoniae]KAI3403599.2 hypothetical protein KGF56_003644 [Candida oxycetoniae]